MRALILLLFLVIATYIIWVAIPKKSRRIAIRKAKPHAIRVGLLVFIVTLRQEKPK